MLNTILCLSNKTVKISVLTMFTELIANTVKYIFLSQINYRR